MMETVTSGLISVLIVVLFFIWGYTIWLFYSWDVARREERREEEKRQREKEERIAKLRSFCETVKPSSDFVITEVYHRGDRGNCEFETKAGLPFRACTKYIHITENHGFVEDWTHWEDSKEEN